LRNTQVAEAISIAKETLCKPFEGYARRLPNGDCHAYPDPGTGAQPWTIGWGSTGPEVKHNTVWTQQQAEASLDNHLLHFCAGVLTMSPTLLQEPPRRLAAIISFAYNCGLRNYRISTLKKRVDAKDWVGASEEIVKWNKAAGRILTGLTRRRQAEARLLK
jgi:GH24 family phage-related lysozyme (muramidase)